MNDFERRMQAIARKNAPPQPTSNISAWTLVLVVAFGVFLTLKLIHKIEWSWWWVTSPLWGGFACALAIYTVVLGVFLVKERPLWGGLFWAALAVVALSVLHCVKGA